MAKRRIPGDVDLEPVEAAQILTGAIVGFLGWLTPLVSPVIFYDSDIVTAVFSGWKSMFFFSMLFCFGGIWLTNLVFRMVRNREEK